MVQDIFDQNRIWKKKTKKQKHNTVQNSHMKGSHASNKQILRFHKEKFRGKAILIYHEITGFMTIYLYVNHKAGRIKIVIIKTEAFRTNTTNILITGREKGGGGQKTANATFRIAL